MKCENCEFLIEEDEKHYCIEDDEYIQQKDLMKDYCIIFEEVK